MNEELVRYAIMLREVLGNQAYIVVVKELQIRYMHEAFIHIMIIAICVTISYFCFRLIQYQLKRISKRDIIDDEAGTMLIFAGVVAMVAIIGSIIQVTELSDYHLWLGITSPELQLAYELVSK